MKCLDIKEKKIFFDSTLGHSQELALKLAGEGKNLIINGSNEVSKEEIITDIIFNELVQGKRVLLVSKNSYSINNIYDRLKYINTKIMFNTDSNNLYKKMSESINSLSKNTGKTTLSKVKVLSRDIDKKIEMLNSINELFCTIRHCGLNLLDMYKISDKKIRPSDTMYDYYKIYRIKKPLMNYKYDEVKNSIDKLLNEDTLDSYVKYRRFKDNKLFSKLTKNITNEGIYEGISKIDYFLNNSISFKLPLCNSKYTEDFISTFLINNQMEVNDIKTLAQVVNLKYNSHILSKENVVKKWNPIYWIKYKSILKIEEDKQIKFNNIEDEIKLELLENLENINLYIKTFDFIKEIVNEDEYNNFIKVLLTTDDITDYLSNLKSTLNIYESFREVVEYVGKFNDIESEILTYCYNNIERKEEMKKLLSYIPKLYIFLNIEEIETSEKEKIYYYKNFEIILKDIQLAINTRNSFMPLVVKYIWDNKVSDILRNRDIDITNYISIVKENLNVYDLLTIFEPIIFDIYPCLIMNSANLPSILAEKKNIFDMIIFYDGNNIYSDEIQYNIYKGNVHIVTGKKSEFNSGCLLDIYSDDYTTIELDDTSLNNNLGNSKDFNSYLQKELYDAFIGLGYKIKININLYEYSLNIVFYNNDYTKVILILECDDLIYNSTYTLRANDLCRRKHLESNNCNIIRVWSRDWWLDKKSEIKRIKYIVDELLLEI